jgi:hypothetical protein
MMRSASLGLSSQTQSTELDRVSQPGPLTDGRDEGRLTDGRADLQQLLGQFRSNYPMGSLTADLLAIQAEQYIVRANIQAGGTLLATAMAAESSLELAEDRARLRALELIGITFTTAQAFGQPMGQQYWPYPNSAPNSAPNLAPQPASSSTISSSRSADAPSQLLGGAAPTALSGSPDSVEEPLDVVLAPDLTLEAPVVPVAPVEPIVMPALETGVVPIVPATPPIAATIVPAASSKSTAKATTKAQPKSDFKPDFKPESKATVPIAPDSKRFVADWSEELSQIEVELKRLSWSDAQEADYLQRTYGQRSRDYITDFDQLTGYLSYLRALPSHFSPALEPAAAPNSDLEFEPDIEPITGLGTNFSGQLASPELASPEPASPAPASPESASPEPVRSDLEPDLGPEAGDDDGPPWVDPGPEADIEEFAGPQFPISSAGATLLGNGPAPTLSPESIALANGGPRPARRPVAPSEAPSRDEMLDESAAECKRLKWTNRQGSDYLKATYGKPTRKDLNNDDLWDFLQYLRSLSMTSEQLPF